MYTSIVILVVLASVLMCLIVLIQESKGGGLAADYSNNNQILGAPKTTNFIEKAVATNLFFSRTLLSRLQPIPITFPV